MAMEHDLSRGAVLLSRLIPSTERDAIVGDLLEDASYCSLSSARREMWLCAELGTIAAGLSLDRLRDVVTLAPMREMAAGLALDGTHALRGVLDAPWPAVGRVALFCAWVAMLAAAAEVLIAALFTASGLQNP
jgi:hypothetical protein